ncbi:MAG: hypothetical protein JOZ49_10055 [Mycolicibacterium sp.]|nr:hypothetical protein [Mycolicibacterium sp.]
MNITHDTKTKRLVAALGVAAAAAVAPALPFAGAGTAHADDACYGLLAGSYYCSLLLGIIRKPLNSLRIRQCNLRSGTTTCRSAQAEFSPP